MIPVIRNLLIVTILWNNQDEVRETVNIESIDLCRYKNSSNAISFVCLRDWGVSSSFPAELLLVEERCLATSLDEDEECILSITRNNTSDEMHVVVSVFSTENKTMRTTWGLFLLPPTLSITSNSFIHLSLVDTMRFNHVFTHITRKTMKGQGNVCFISVSQGVYAQNITSIRHLLHNDKRVNVVWSFRTHSVTVRK